MEREKIINLPNAISFVRLCSVPFMIYFVFSGRVQLFTWFLVCALISDIVDGLIARVFHLQTSFGATLDAAADMGTYISAVIGIILFKMDFIQTHKIAIFLILAFYIGEKGKTWYHYKRPMNSFHTYLSKITAYFQGAFIVWLFLFGYNPILFYSAMAFCISANIEEMILSSILKRNAPDVKGLLWVVRKQPLSGR